VPKILIAYLVTCAGDSDGQMQSLSYRSLRVTELGDGSTLSGSGSVARACRVRMNQAISVILYHVFLVVQAHPGCHAAITRARRRLMAVHNNCRRQALRTSPR